MSCISLRSALLANAMYNKVKEGVPLIYVGMALNSHGTVVESLNECIDDDDNGARTDEDDVGNNEVRHVESNHRGDV